MAKVTLVENELDSVINYGDLVVINGNVHMISRVFNGKYFLVSIGSGDRWDDRPFGCNMTINELIEYCRIYDENKDVRYIRNEDFEIEIHLK